MNSITLYDCIRPNADACQWQIAGGKFSNFIRQRMPLIERFRLLYVFRSLPALVQERTLRKSESAAATGWEQFEVVAYFDISSQPEQRLFTDIGLNPKSTSRQR